MNDTLLAKLSPELRVLSLVVVLGFGGGAVLYVFGMPPIIVAVFLATGVASVVYGFLGGIHTAAFDLGPIRFGGSIAALLGSAWFIDVQLVQQIRFEPPVETLFAMDINRGVPISVKAGGMKDAIKLPSSDVLVNNQVDIRHLGDRFRVVSEADPDFVFGMLSREDLRQVGLFNIIRQQLRGFFVTGRLEPNTENVDLGLLPFRISTLDYAGEYSGYALSDTAGQFMHGGRIYRRQAEIVRHQGKNYLVAVVEVNHEGQSPYAKFVVGEVLVDIVP